jgi:AhpD family alkylhydroperoxidase
MSRVAMLPVEQWDAELRAAVAADQATPLEQGPLRMMAHTPEITKPFLAFAIALVTQSELPRRLLELVRLRIAFHNQCRSCMAIRYRSAVDDGLTEGLVCSLEKPSEAPDLNDAEKAALAYADQSATDHFSIDDSTYDKLRPYFTEKQIVELGMFIAYCIGFGRLAAGWNMIGELPESYQEEPEGASIAPWKMDSIVVRG